jgi:hypothetical protein
MNERHIICDIMNGTFLMHDITTATNLISDITHQIILLHFYHNKKHLMCMCHMPLLTHGEIAIILHTGTPQN